MKRFVFLVFALLFLANTFAIIGDINNDGVIDGYDLNLLARAFGSVQGDDNFCILADLSGSLRIDGEDLAIIASNFGRHLAGNQTFYLISEGSYGIYDYSKTIDTPFLALADPGMRYRIVEVTPEIKCISGVRKGDSIILNLFRDKEYYSYVDRVNQNINGTVSVRARLKGYNYAYAIITSTGENSLVSVSIPELSEYYRVFQDHETKEHVLVEYNNKDLNFLQSYSPLYPAGPVMEEISAEAFEKPYFHTKDEDDTAYIDIMIVYTPRAAQWASTNGGIHNIIAQAVETAQLTLDNSLTGINFTLVFTGEVDYTESGSSSVDLRRLTASPDFNPWGNTYDGYAIPGFMDEVHGWRDAYGADLVGLFTHVNDTGGLGWQLNHPSGRPDYAFNITRVQQAATGFTYIHECGHNMGAHHHKEQNVQPGPGLWPYSAGWRWVGDNNSRYCSVMTYSSGEYFDDGRFHTNVAYFSNPDVIHFGVPTGHPQDGDNARTLRQIKHVIAAYRESVEMPPNAPTGLGYEIISSNKINLFWTDNSINELGFEVFWKTEADGPFVHIGSTAANITAWDHDIDPNITNFYRVRAYNQHGNSDFTNEIEVLVGMGW